jgi:hypothetical protein
LDPTFFPPIEFQLIPPRYSFLCSIWLHGLHISSSLTFIWFFRY